MISINYKEMGQRIRKQREFLNMSREELAQKLGVTPKFCSDIELGIKGMSIQTLHNISIHLNLSTDYILYGKANESDTSNIVRMLESCQPEKIKYAEDLIKTFILAIN
ncbi:MAG: family transcriptional regulator [Oscillospiraceae bacterium]|nr:family transcriptional regulator [Oscillospiraceae bacterium]